MTRKKTPKKDNNTKVIAKEIKNMTPEEKVEELKKILKALSLPLKELYLRIEEILGRKFLTSELVIKNLPNLYKEILRSNA